MHSVWMQGRQILCSMQEGKFLKLCFEGFFICHLQADYCSEKHQRADWKAGHKSRCKQGGESNGLLPPKSSLLLPEGLIESEPEPKRGGKDDTEQNIDQYR